MGLVKTKLGKGVEWYFEEDDNFVGQRMALGKYEPYESQLILSKVKSGDKVIDVGANIGYYTVLLAKKAGETGRVWAIEPEGKSLEILKKNIRENRLKNVKAIRAAASDKEEEMELRISKKNKGDHKLFGGGMRERVKTIVLDEILAKEGKIRMIKIDTQGWEPKVIEGAKKIIERDRPIIFMEYSPASYKEAGLEEKRMREFLVAIYSEIWAIDEWLYSYQKVKGNWEKYVNPKTGYADLWMGGKENGWDRIKDLKPKKLVKKILGKDWRK
jgi:FkbM family methyltransferase